VGDCLRPPSGRPVKAVPTGSTIRKSGISLTGFLDEGIVEVGSTENLSWCHERLPGFVRNAAGVDGLGTIAPLSFIRGARNSMALDALKAHNVW